MTHQDHERENLHLLEAVRLMIEEQAKKQRSDMDKVRCSINKLSKQVNDLTKGTKQ